MKRKEIKEAEDSRRQRFLKIPILSFLTPSTKLKKPELRTTTVLINGKLATCIILSIVSAIVDLVFFSGLSKSFYDLFGFIAIPAGLLLSVMSIGFSMGKFFCAMQLGAIAELKTRLKNFGYAWYNNLNKLSWKWQVIHKFLIGVSILTSISLSVISIGTGVTRNSTLLKQLDDLIVQGTRYGSVLDTARDTSLKATVSKSVDTSEQDAITYTTTQMNLIRPAVEQYKADRETFNRTGIDINSTEPNDEYAPNPSEYWNRRNESVNNLLQNAGYGSLTGRQIYNLNLNSVQATIRSRYLSTYQSRNPEEIKREMEEARQSTIEEANGWLKTLNALNFTRNERVDLGKGRYEYRAVPVKFDDDVEATDTKVLLTRALSLLRQYRTDVESDNGDIGASSKLFMMIGNAWDKLHAKSADNVTDALTVNVKTGMGSTEIMIMVIIMLFGIVQEFLIALFTPKSTISRKMLYQFDAYFEGDFNLNRFCLTLYLDYYNKGIISKEDFEAKAKKCVELLQNTEDKIIERYTKKDKDSGTELKRLQDELKQAKEDNSQSLEKIAQLKQSLQNSDEKMKEFLGAISASNMPQASKKRVIADQTQTGYSDAVTKAVEEVESLLKS